MKLRLVPVTLKVANAFVGEKHRHHDPVVQHRWSVGAALDGKLVGVAICERAKARLESPFMCEATRVCTDGTRNACSILYAGCARAAEGMGYDAIKTFILASEPGTSLRAAGWLEDGEVEAQDWDRPSRKRGVTEHSTEKKVRYIKILRLIPGRVEIPQAIFCDNRSKGLFEQEKADELRPVDEANGNG